MTEVAKPARANGPMSWALRQPLRAPEKNVLCALAWRAWSDGVTAWPSIKTLAFDAGLSEGAVKDSVARLEGCGLISVTRAKGSHGRQANNRYHLNLHINVTEEQALALRGRKAGAKPQSPGGSGGCDVSSAMPHQQAGPQSLGGSGVSSLPASLNVQPESPGDLGRSHLVTMPEPPGDSDRSHPVAHKEKLKEKCKENSLKEVVGFASSAALNDDELLRLATAGSLDHLDADQQLRGQRLFSDYLNALFGSQREVNASELAGAESVELHRASDAMPNREAA